MRIGSRRGRAAVALVAVVALVALTGCTVLSDGFESGDLSHWTQEHGVTVGQSTVKDGAFAADADATTAPAWTERQLAESSSLVTVTAEVRVAQLPVTGAATLLGIRTGADAPLTHVEVDAAGVLHAVDDTAPSDTPVVGTALQTGRWYLLELDTDVRPGQQTPLTVKLDGTTVAATTVAAPARAGYVQLGDRTRTSGSQVTYDDVKTVSSDDGLPVQPVFPIRAAFYYPWFPQSWTQLGTYPYTQYHPSLGFYSSTDEATVRSHIRSMKYGGIRAGIASWWGQGHYTDQAIPTLLQAARDEGGDFRWALYYEREGNPTTPGGNPTVEQITSDLTYIWNTIAQDDMYLRVDGRPVIFVYDDSTTNAQGCDMTQRWVDARNAAPGNFYLDLKVFPQYTTCPAQPDNWHQYAPATATDKQGTHAFTISPGFWKSGETDPRLARDPAAWATNVASMRASNANFELITTFNEWGEGTAVESATEWSTASGQGTYLDVLHASLFDNR
jgi:hypothetical protein